MEWANNLQKAVIQEWLEGVQRNSSPEAKRKLRKEIAEKYEITIGMVQGIIRLQATEGLQQVNKQDHGEYRGHSYEPINYHELVNGLKERIKTLERNFEYILEGIERIAQARQSYEIHLQQLQTIGKRLKGRSVADLGEWPLSIEGGR